MNWPNINDSRHHALMDAIRNNDMNHLRQLVDANNPASNYHISIAFSSSKAEALEYLIEHAEDGAGAMYYLHDIVTSKHLTGTPFVTEDTFEVAYSEIKKAGVQTDPLIVIALQHGFNNTVLDEIKDNSNLAFLNDVMHRAAIYNNFKIVHATVAAGGRVSHGGERSLVASLMMGQYAMARLLIELGADLDHLSKSYTEPSVTKLFNAIAGKDADIETLGAKIRDFQDRLRQDKSIDQKTKAKLDLNRLKTLSLAQLRKETLEYKTGETTIDRPIFHALIEAGEFDLALNAAKKAPPEDGLTLCELLQPHPETQESVLDCLAKRGQLDRVLDPSLWVQRSEVLTDLVTRYLPRFSRARYETDLKSLLSKVQHAEISQNMRTRKPPKLG